MAPVTGVTVIFFFFIVFRPIQEKSLKNLLVWKQKAQDFTSGPLPRLLSYCPVSKNSPVLGPTCFPIGYMENLQKYFNLKPEGQGFWYSVHSFTWQASAKIVPIIVLG